MAKNQKSSKPGSAAYVETGDGKRLVPLGGGHCYLRDPRNGKTYHLKVESVELVEKIMEISEVYQIEKIKGEIKHLSKVNPENKWVELLEKLPN